MQLKWTDEASLRRLAEEGMPRGSMGRAADVRADAHLYELLVHKTELEMQNEALRDAQSELASAHERYKMLFDNAPTAYVVLDAGCRITAVNERAAKLFGDTPGSLLGARMTRFLISEEAISFERYRRQVKESVAPLCAEFTMVIGGEEREIRVESVSRDREGVEWYVALADVTAFNAMVRRLDHDERLRAVQQRASTVAHSLNNLLYSIQGHADIALRFIEPHSRAYTPLIHMREVVQRCASATQQLSSFSRAEVDHPTIVDLNAVLTDLQGLLPALLDDSIDVELHLGASDGDVRLSRMHVEQILLTAARNARHAMPHGGSFRVETANTESNGGTGAPGDTSTRFVRWTLSDTGVGMTESTRSRAFEPFFTTKPPGVGTGLGLSMVKAAVERSGGFVQLESEPGRGTNLIIHLPRATGTSSFPRPRGDGVTPANPIATILLVGDDVEIASDIASRLRDAECYVLCLASADAIDFLRRAPMSLNVLVVDESYPDFVVAELVRVAREVSPRVEIVVTSLDTSSGGADGDASEPLEDAVDLALCAAVRANSQ